MTPFPWGFRGKQFGYGVVGYRGGEIAFELAIGPDRRSSVFDAEMFTLAHFCKRAPTRLNRHTPIVFFFFFSDRASALSATWSSLTCPGQVGCLSFIGNCSDTLLSFADLPVSLEWSPDHAGAIENEVAHKLAK
jgi:hypothetical protein